MATTVMMEVTAMVAILITWVVIEAITKTRTAWVLMDLMVIREIKGIEMIMIMEWVEEMTIIEDLITCTEVVNEEDQETLEVIDFRITAEEVLIEEAWEVEEAPTMIEAMIEEGTYIVFERRNNLILSNRSRSNDRDRNDGNPNPSYRRRSRSRSYEDRGPGGMQNSRGRFNQGGGMSRFSSNIAGNQPGENSMN